MQSKPTVMHCSFPANLHRVSQVAPLWDSQRTCRWEFPFMAGSPAAYRWVSQGMQPSPLPRCCGSPGDIHWVFQRNLTGRPSKTSAGPSRTVHCQHHVRPDICVILSLSDTVAELPRKSNGSRSTRLSPSFLTCPTMRCARSPKQGISFTTGTGQIYFRPFNTQRLIYFVFR
jgi:hypothetical protein